MKPQGEFIILHVSTDMSLKIILSYQKTAPMWKSRLLLITVWLFQF